MAGELSAGVDAPSELLLSWCLRALRRGFGASVDMGGGGGGSGVRSVSAVIRGVSPFGGPRYQSQRDLLLHHHHPSASGTILYPGHIYFHYRLAGNHV